MEKKNHTSKSVSFNRQGDIRQENRYLIVNQTLITFIRIEVQNTMNFLLIKIQG